VSSLFSPKAPKANNSVIGNNSLSSARGSSLLSSGINRSATSSRMPVMPVAPMSATGNMALKGANGPLPPVPPMNSRLTKNPLDAAYEKESNRRGMLSTFLGRAPKEATAVFRKNSLSNIIGM